MTKAEKAKGVRLVSNACDEAVSLLRVHEFRKAAEKVNSISTLAGFLLGMGVDANELGKPFERYGYAVSEAADTAHTAEARRVEREARGHRMATAKETRAHVLAYKAKYPKARSLMSYNLNDTVGIDATADHLALLEMAKRRDTIYHVTTGQGAYRCEHFYFI